VTKIEFLWFGGCANHEQARALLHDVIANVAPGVPVEDIDAGDEIVAIATRFPGSPTIRINGRDIDPRYTDPGDYAPRCRVFWTADGLRGIPPREWIEDALRTAVVRDEAVRRAT
jgi:hypothetical protein